MDHKLLMEIKKSLPIHIDINNQTKKVEVVDNHFLLQNPMQEN